MTTPLIKPGPALKAAVAVFMIFFIAASLETAARLLPAGRDELSLITGILRQDPDLFWTQKPGLETVFSGVPLRLNSLGFRGAEPETPKSGFRIVIMGASPALGWGVREKLTYADILRRRLKADGKPVEIINASVIGYSSFQGVKLLRGSVLPLKPDLVIITYGVNDPDKYRFFMDSGLCDKDVRPASPFISAANRAAQASRAFTLYARLVRRLTGMPSGSGRGGVFRENRRVSKEDFSENLKQLAAEARSSGAKVIFATNPFTLPPGTKRPGWAARAEADALAAQAQRICAGKPCRDPVLLKKALELDPGSPRALFLLAADSRAEERDALLKKAGLSELEDCMAVLERYNRDIRSLAGGLGAPLCDLEMEFAHGGRRPDLFLDPEKDMVHFSAAGHQKAADALAKLIEKMIK